MQSRVSTYAAVDVAGLWDYAVTASGVDCPRCTARAYTRATAQGLGCMKAALAHQLRAVCAASAVC